VQLCKLTASIHTYNYGYFSIALLHLVIHQTYTLPVMDLTFLSTLPFGLVPYSLVGVK